MLETFADTAFTADGMLKKGWPFSEGRDLFDNGLKYLYKLIENHMETKIFVSNIFMIDKVLASY